MQQKSNRTDLTNRPNDPAQEKHQCHCQRHVQVRVCASKQWILDLKTVRRLTTPTNNSKSRNQARPIREQDEDKDAREIPKRPVNQVASNYSFKKILQAL